MKQAFRATQEGLHPRVIGDGFEAARLEALNYLDSVKVVKEDAANDRALLRE